MARQPDIQYISLYTHGSAARKLEPQRKKEKVSLPLPKPRQEKPRVIYVDPLSLCAMAAAGLLLVTMAVGMIRLGITNTRTAQMEEYVSRLRDENAQLHEEFNEAYDPELVRQKALQMGLIPREEAQQVTLPLTVPQPEQEPGFWEKIGMFFSELFA